MPQTTDQDLIGSVFVSSRMQELPSSRRAVLDAVASSNLIPVLYEVSALSLLDRERVNACKGANGTFIHEQERLDRVHIDRLLGRSDFFVMLVGDTLGTAKTVFCNRTASEYELIRFLHTQLLLERELSSEEIRMELDRVFHDSYFYTFEQAPVDELSRPHSGVRAMENATGVWTTIKHELAQFHRFLGLVFPPGSQITDRTSAFLRLLSEAEGPGGSDGPSGRKKEWKAEYRQIVSQARPGDSLRQEWLAFKGARLLYRSADYLRIFATRTRVYLLERGAGRFVDSTLSDFLQCIPCVRYSSEPIDPCGVSPLGLHGGLEPPGSNGSGTHRVYRSGLCSLFEHAQGWLSKLKVGLDEGTVMRQPSFGTGLAVNTSKKDGEIASVLEVVYRIGWNLERLFFVPAKGERELHLSVRHCHFNSRAAFLSPNTSLEAANKELAKVSSDRKFVHLEFRTVDVQIDVPPPKDLEFGHPEPTCLEVGVASIPGMMFRLLGCIASVSSLKFILQTGRVDSLNMLKTFTLVFAPSPSGNVSTTLFLYTLRDRFGVEYLKEIDLATIAEYCDKNPIHRSAI